MFSRKSPSGQDFAENVKHKMWLKVGLDDIEIVKSKFHFFPLIECIYFTFNAFNTNSLTILFTGPHSTVSNVSGYRCVSDCRSRGRKFDPGLVSYSRGD